MPEPKLYKPSNGTEGDSFLGRWCSKCKRDTGMRGGTVYCSILNKSMSSEKPVKQWVVIEGIPVCTSYTHYQSKQPHKKHRKQHNQLSLEV